MASYSLESLADSSIWLLTLRGAFDRESIDGICYEASIRMQAWEFGGRLIVDLNPVALGSHEDVGDVLKALLGSLLGTNFEALFDYVFLSENPVVTQYICELEAQGMRVSMFTTMADALTFFNLKESSERLRQSMRHTITRDVRETAPYVDISYDTNSLERSTKPFPRNGLLELFVVDCHDSMVVAPQSELVLGRRSLGGVQPHIDLSLWGAYEKGVSRCHAKLLLDADGQLCIVALDSANGTFVNGQKLETGQRYVLQEFDDIRLGHMTLNVSYQSVEAASELS